MMRRLREYGEAVARRAAEQTAERIGRRLERDRRELAVTIERNRLRVRGLNLARRRLVDPLLRFLRDDLR
jgi:hypothetical protein